MLQTWRRWMWGPQIIICDSGSNCDGESWRQASALYGITISPSPPGASYRTGEVGRHVQILRTPPKAISVEFGWGDSQDIRLGISDLASNITPCVKTWISPITSLAGRNRFYESVPGSTLKNKDIGIASPD